MFVTFIKCFRQVVKNKVNGQNCKISCFFSKFKPTFQQLIFHHNTGNQRWSRGHKARGQGHKKNPRPRTAFPRTDTLEAKDRNARGQGQGPRTQSASALQKKKKKGLHKNFSGDLQKKKKKKGLHKNFSSDLHEKTLSKKFFNRSTKF